MQTNKARNDLSFHKLEARIYKEIFSAENVSIRAKDAIKQKELRNQRLKRKWSFNYKKELERNDLSPKQRQDYRKNLILKENNEFPELEK